MSDINRNNVPDAMHLNNLESFALSKLLQSGCAVADEVVAAVRVPVVHLDPDHDGDDDDDDDYGGKMMVMVIMMMIMVAR